MRTTKSITISLPPEQLKTAERLAKEQSRTMSELFREALRRYEREERHPSPDALKQLAKAIEVIQQDARRAGLTKMSMREIDAEVQAVRRHKPKAKKSVNRSGV